jgi:hypothetical protein
MNMNAERMKPNPPTTCGTQYTPFMTARDMELKMGGRAVMPAIQKMEAATSWTEEPRKPISLR